MNEILQKKFLIAAIFLAVINVLGFNHLLELMAEEPRRSIIAIEMLWSGDYAIPHIYNEIYYNKPPVYNWLMACSMYLFGTGEWAARLPGALSFLLTGLVLYKMSSKYLSENISLLICFAYLTSIDLLIYGSVNTAEIDIFYSLVTVLQVYAIFHYKQTNQYLKLFIVSYLLAALGVLVKGIPSIAFQGLTLLVYFIVTKSFTRLFSWKHLIGGLLFLLVVVGYLFYFSLYEDVWGFLSQQFQEASQRSANETTPLDLFKNMGSFIVKLFEKLAPWSLFVVFLAKKSVRRQIIENPFLKFSLIFILANVIIYWTASDLRTRYIYMFFPFFIILLVSPLEKLDWSSEIIKKTFYVFLFVLCILPIGIIALPFILGITSVKTVVIAIGLGLILGLLVIYNFMQKQAHQTMWTLIIALLIGRLAFNSIVMPEMSNLSSRLHFRTTIGELIDHSEGKPIVLAGPITRYYPKITILGDVFYDDVIEYPTEVAFQIPYYYAHQTGQIMEFDADPRSTDVNYLMYELFLDRFDVEKKILYRFKTKYNNEEIVLFSVIKD